MSLRACCRGVIGRGVSLRSSPIPILAPLPLHGDAGGIADLDPDRTRTGSRGAVDTFGDDAFCTGPASAREDDDPSSAKCSLNRIPARHCAIGAPEQPCGREIADGADPRNPLRATQHLLRPFHKHREPRVHDDGHAGGPICTRTRSLGHRDLDHRPRRLHQGHEPLRQRRPSGPCCYLAESENDGR
jgi:hypothetical protein